MPNIVVLLSKQGFPYATRMVLAWLQKYFNHCDMFPPGKFPNKEHVLFIMDSFVFFKTNQVHVKLTPVRELQLLEEICKFFEGSPLRKTRMMMFDALFGTSNNPNTQAEIHRRNILHKLVSLAVSLEYHSILDCAALWVYNQSQIIFQTGLANNIFKDFCELVPKSLSSLKNLSSSCPDLANQLIGVAFYTHNAKGLKNVHQSSLNQLLKIATEWISNDQTLILNHLTTSFPDIKSFRRTLPPDQIQRRFEINTLLNVIQYCILNPLQTRKDSSDRLLVSKLFFATMQSVLIAQNFTSNQSHLEKLFIRMEDLAKIVSEIKGRLPDFDKSGEEVEICIERLAETLQILVASGGLHATSDDLSKLCRDLPQEGLLEIVLEASH